MKKNLIFFGFIWFSSLANATFEEAVKKFQDLTPNLKWSTFHTEQNIQELIKNSIRELFYKQIEIVLNILDKKSKSEILENLSEEKNKHEQAFQNFSQDLRQFIQPDFLDKFCAELQERKEKFAPHKKICQLDWTKPCQKFKPFSEMSILAYGLEDQIRSRPDEIIQWDQMDSFLKEAAEFYNQVDQEIKKKGFFKTINHIHSKKELPWLVDLDDRNAYTWPLDLYELEVAAFKPNAAGNITDKIDKIKKEIAYQIEDGNLMSILIPFFDTHFIDYFNEVSSDKTLTYYNYTVKEQYSKWTKWIKSLPGSKPSETDENRMLQKLNLMEKLSEFSEIEDKKLSLTFKYSLKTGTYKSIETKKNNDKNDLLQFMNLLPNKDLGPNILLVSAFRNTLLYENFVKKCFNRVKELDKKLLNKFNTLNLNSNEEFKENIEKENARKIFKKDLKDEYQRIRNVKKEREKAIIEIKQNIQDKVQKNLKEGLEEQLGSQKKLAQEEEKSEKQKN